jgi:hypothetical protein
MRWWLRIILILVVFICVATVGTWYYLFRMNGLEDLVSGQINRALSKQLPLKFSVGSIKGDLVTEIILQDVVVQYADSLGGKEFFSAHQITASFELSNLLRRSFLFGYVWFDSAKLVIARDENGKLILPKPSSKDTTIGNSSFDLSVDKLLLNSCGLTIIGPADTLRLDSINWDGALKIENGTMAASINQARMSSNQAMLNVSGLSGKITYADGNLVLQDVSVAEGAGRFKTSGSINIASRSGQFAFNADDADIAALAGLFGVKLNGTVDAYGNVTFSQDKLFGNVALGGQFLIAGLENLNVDFRVENKHLYLDTLRGIVLDNCAVDGNAEIDFSQHPAQYTADLNVSNFNLSKLIAGSFSSDLTGHIQLNGSSFKNQDMVLDIITELHESTFHGYPIQTATGNMIITTKTITFPEPFLVSYFENQFSVSGEIEYSGNMLLNVQANLDNIDRYRGRLFLDQPGGRGYAEATISGKSKDPDLDGFFVSDSAWLYGLYADSCDISYHVRQFLSAQRGVVEARFLNGGLWNIPYDTAYTVLTLDSDVVKFDTLFARNSKASLVSRGYLNHLIYPQHVTVDTLNLTLFDKPLYNRGKMIVFVDSTGFDFRQAAIGSDGQMLMALGRLNYDESMELALSVNDVPILNWVTLVRKDFPSNGRVSFQSNLNGTFRNPSFSIQGKIDSLTYNDLVLGNLNVAASYGQQTLTIDSLMLESHPGMYFARGYLNVDVDLTSDSLATLLDQPFDVTISATDKRFDLVTMLLPSVEELKGDFASDFRLFGTPSSPHLEGEATLKNAYLKYFDLVDTVFADSATVTMKDNQIIIDRIETYVIDKRQKGRRSPAIIDGIITVKSLGIFTYNVDVQIPMEFPVEYELEDIQGRIKGNLHVDGDTPPTVTGDLEVINARYLANFATPEEGSPLMTVLSGERTWDLDINIDVPSNYWIKNNDIDAEFSGQLNIIREKGNYRFIGEMEILRGKGFLFDKVFQIDAGSTVNYNNIDSLNPALDITGYTRIAGLSQSGESSKDEELGIHITGTLDAPEFNTVGTNFSREDIVPLLVTNNTGTEGSGSGTFGRIEQRLTGLVSSQVSQIGTRQLSRLGVETFEIDPTYEGTLDPLKSRVTVGFYPTKLLPGIIPGDKLYIYGRTALSNKLGQEYGFEYRFNRSFLLEGRRDEEQLYHLNFKLKLEF